jgi:hypothetical protein
MAVQSPPILGAEGVILPARVLRNAVGAPYLNDPAGIQATSGVLAGPDGTMGELTLAGNVVTVSPFRAVIQNTQDFAAGQYVISNDGQVQFTLSGQDGSQTRRTVIAVGVADSEVAGVASTATTDRGWLLPFDGPLAASAAAAALPDLPDNTLPLGEVVSPPAGQARTLVPYNPRTTTRGGILPVLNDGSTRPGHSGAPGSYDGQARFHPLVGLQVWTAAAGQWRTVGTVPLTSDQRKSLTVSRWAGMFVYETDTTQLLRWNGTQWRPAAPDHRFSQGGTNTGWASTDPLWVPGLGDKMTVPDDGVARDWQASVACNVKGSGFLRLRVDRAAGGGKPAASDYYPNGAGLRAAGGTELSLSFHAAATLTGDQAATFYVEARRENTATVTDIIIPTVRLDLAG